MSEKSNLSILGLSCLAILGLLWAVLGTSLGLSWAALRLSWVVSGYLAAVIQVFGPTKKGMN